MRKGIACLLILILIASATALAEDVSAAYAAFLAEEGPVPLEDAWALLGALETPDGDVLALQAEMADLPAARGNSCSPPVPRARCTPPT